MSGGTKVSTTETGPWEEQKPYLLGGFDEAKRLYNEGVPSYYQGPTVADITPAQRWADQSTIGYAMGPRAAGMQAGAEGSLMRSLMGTTGFSPLQRHDLLAGNVRTGPGTPYGQMENALTQGVMSNLHQNILPGIRTQQVQYQPGGSSRGNLVQNQAIARAVQSGLTKPLADMYSGAYQTAQGMRFPMAQMEIGQQQFGQQMYPTIMGAPLGMYNAARGAGARQQAINQELINQNMARYNYEANAPQTALANYMNMIGGNYGSSTTQTTPGPSGFSQMTSLLGAVAPLFAPSDIRIKENITPDGKWKGYNTYRFNYIGDNVRRRGVMAQEVEKTRPDAVVEMGGIKHVNYGAL